MPTIADAGRPVIGGVDTHAGVHVAEMVNQAGGCCGPGSSRPPPRTMRGGAWMRGHGDLARFGMEGTGSYGAGLARHLASSSTCLSRARSAATAAASARNSSSLIPGDRRSVNTTSHARSSAITRIGL